MATHIIFLLAFVLLLLLFRNRDALQQLLNESAPRRLFKGRAALVGLPTRANSRIAESILAAAAFQGGPWDRHVCAALSRDYKLAAVFTIIVDFLGCDPFVAFITAALIDRRLVILAASEALIIFLDGHQSGPIFSLVLDSADAIGLPSHIGGAYLRLLVRVSLAGLDTRIVRVTQVQVSVAHIAAHDVSIGIPAAQIVNLCAVSA